MGHLRARTRRGRVAATTKPAGRRPAEARPAVPGADRAHQAAPGPVGGAGRDGQHPPGAVDHGPATPCAADDGHRHPLGHGDGRTPSGQWRATVAVATQGSCSTRGRHRAGVDVERAAGGRQARPPARSPGGWCGCTAGHGDHPGREDAGVEEEPAADAPARASTTSATSTRQAPAPAAGGCTADPPLADAGVDRPTACPRRRWAVLVVLGRRHALVRGLAVGAASLHRSKPTRRTSVARTTPKRSRHRVRHVGHQRRTSSAEPPSSAWMKLACFVETLGPMPEPEALAARPRRSAARPSRPGGLVKTEPALLPPGWCSRRQRTISASAARPASTGSPGLQARTRPRAPPRSAPSGRGAVAEAERRPRPRRRAARRRRSIHR